MLHFSCDRCGKPLGKERFVVRVEVYPAFDPEEFDETDLDVDHLQELAETLEEMERTGANGLEDVEPKQYRFDLCPECHTQYVLDPLGRDRRMRLKYSQN